MLLIFGGTTEGRVAVDVCEEAGKPFYYSTKSNLQNVELHNGVRLSGAMTKDEIVSFCNEHEVRCLVDAAHPFAENLHKTIAEVGMPVIRLQRQLGKKMEGCIYCKDYEDAIQQMQAAGIRKLLALSGVNTIAKLKPFWQNHPTIFRILNREESLTVAEQNGFPKDRLIYYPEKNRCEKRIKGSDPLIQNSNGFCLPSIEDEKEVMLSVGCDAIITKESGESGGFEAKVKAAMELGIKVFVIEPPSLSDIYSETQSFRLHAKGKMLLATGKHTLRRAIQELVPDFFPLKTGLTTGACATAATKAALLSMLYDELPEEVSFALPDGEVLTIPVTVEGKGRASVVKDFSDDPDVLRGCRITATLTLQSSFPKDNGAIQENGMIRFLPGEGVGTVTLPGLGIPVGEPAINPTPRKMIEDEVRQVLSEYDGDIPLPMANQNLFRSACRRRVEDRVLGVSISVENGRELALKTFNPKVGVVDGISIIGTSGIVSPLSNEAFVASIGRELEVAKAIGCKEIGIASGKKGEEALKERYPELRVIHYGNFIGETLKKAHSLGFQKVVLGIMIGKAVKLAEGHLDTHSHKVTMNLEFIKRVAATLSPSGEMPQGDGLNITMARELWDIMPQEFFDKITELCYKHCRTVFPDGEVEVLLIHNS